jgi:hypothetical protein
MGMGLNTEIGKRLAKRSGNSYGEPRLRGTALV